MKEEEDIFANSKAHQILRLVIVYLPVMTPILVYSFNLQFLFTIILFIIIFFCKQCLYLGNAGDTAQYSLVQLI